MSNELGMVTVKCQVVENARAILLWAFVMGNHPLDPDDTEKEANLYVSKFNNAHKRHCYPQRKYRPSGAYDTNWNPK